MKKELLCPAGSRESLEAAIHNGADAVYLAGTSYGARSSASNFTNEELIDAINYSHLYGVKVYITINTLIKNDEIDDVLKFVDFLYENKADALILQDVGIASCIHNSYPDFELHASTQMHNLDKYSFDFLKELGFSRVIVARELSLNEINTIETDLEIEAFIHGALCMSYSGQCLMSSMAVKRSGNRGVCAQLCRMPYEIDGKKAYYLSPKDVSTVPIFDDIMNSNIYSLKIEGRMKSPAYVAVVTKLYRKLIDAFYNKEKANIDDELNKLDYLFNRGYSCGYIGDDIDILNIKRPNHKGVYIGDIISFTDDIVTIKLIKSLHVGDGIKFELQDKGLNVFNFYINNKQVKDASDGDIITIPNKIGINSLDKVLKTSDVLIEKESLEYEKKSVMISVDILGLINNKFKLTMSDGINSITKYGDVIVKAQNKAVTKDDIIEKVSKLGNTPFKIEKISIKLDDNIFIPLSSINNLRREVTDQLINCRLNSVIRSGKINKKILINKRPQKGISVYVRNNDQLKVVRNYKVDKIYTNNYELYKNNSDLNIFYEVNIGENRELNNDKLLINSTSDINKYKNSTLSLNYTFNILNKFSDSYFNFDKTISPELSVEELSDFDNSEILIYGRVRVMMTKQCFFSKDCNSCSNILTDSFGNRYLKDCINKIHYLYNYIILDYINLINEYNFNSFRIDFYEESEALCNEVLTRFFQQINKK